MKVKNPDLKGIYHCWHFCLKCGETWAHSQGSVNQMKSHNCIQEFGWDVIQTVPSWIKEIRFETPEKIERV